MWKMVSFKAEEDGDISKVKGAIKNAGYEV